MKNATLTMLLLTPAILCSCQVAYLKSADGTVDFSDTTSPVYTVSGHMTGNGDFFPDLEYQSLLSTGTILRNSISIRKNGEAPSAEEKPELLSTIIDGWAAPEYWKFRKQYLPKEKTYMGYGLGYPLVSDPCVFTYVTIKIKHAYVHHQYVEDGMRFREGEWAWVCVHYLSIEAPKPEFIQQVIHEYGERQEFFSDFRFVNGAPTDESDRGRIVEGDLWMYRPYRKQLMINNGNMIGAQCYDEAKAARDRH